MSREKRLAAISTALYLVMLFTMVLAAFFFVKDLLLVSIYLVGITLVVGFVQIFVSEMIRK